MIDLEKFTQEYWGLLRRHAYRLTGSILDAEDISQETMLRVVEMGPSLENIDDHNEWLHTAATEAAFELLKSHKPVSLEEFDLPDLIQTNGACTDPNFRSLEGEDYWPEVPLHFLFPLQYMEPEQRPVVVLRDGFEDGDRMAAEALHVTIPEVFEIAEEAEKIRSSVRKRWGSTVPFVSLDNNEKSEKVFKRFLEIFQMKDKVLLQQVMWKNTEMILGPERTTGEDFVATELASFAKGMGDKIRFSPVWLNGYRGVLIEDWQELRSEWLRVALGLILCSDREVRALKWFLDGHILRKIETDDTESSLSG